MKGVNTNMDYLSMLLYPEKWKGCRIPSEAPVPTSTVQMTSSFLFSPESDSVVVINPWFLYSQEAFDKVGLANVKGLTSAMYSWSDDMTSRFRPFGIAKDKTPFVKQNIPDIFNSYRLVSGSLEVRYADAIDKAEGMICGGIVNKPIDIGGYYGANLAYLSGHMILGDFSRDVLKNMPSYKEIFCLNGGLRMVYYPIDNSYFEFTRIAKTDDIGIKDVDTEDEKFMYLDVNKQCYKPGFGWFIFFEGVTSRDLWFKFDVCCNFELMPKAEYVTYLNVQVNAKKKMSDNERAKLVNKVMNECSQYIKTR